MPEPKRPADLLRGILRDARAAAARAPTARLLAEILEQTAAGHCRVASERGGRLLVDVDSAPLFAELQTFRREEIRRALNERLGGSRAFAELTFRLHAVP